MKYKKKRKKIQNLHAKTVNGHIKIYLCIYIYPHLNVYTHYLHVYVHKHDFTGYIFKNIAPEQAFFPCPSSFTSFLLPPPLLT
uniref:Uncharacterized protein n=1 Tax=Anguilla anguilla TaxID=7936 RepID=A0A0E9WL44_ANGAN